MSSRLRASVVIAFALCISAPAQAAVQFVLLDDATRSGSVVVAPGASFSAIVLALGVAADPASGANGNLDSFTYRVVFPTETFTLQSNLFAAPFDNNQAPLGFNGSRPWAGLPLAVNNGADAGSPGATAFVADLYRTTATQLGNAATQPEILLETLGLAAPHVQGVYPISLQVLEAADSFGTLHVASVGSGLTITVVPEPAALWLVASGLALLCLMRHRRGGSPPHAIF